MDFVNLAEERLTDVSSKPQTLNPAKQHWNLQVHIILEPASVFAGNV
jgi:hypothetical protein